MSREEEDARQALRALVERRSAAEFRTVCIEALRRWRKDPAGEPCVLVHGQFGRVFAQVLAEQGGDVPQPVYWKECLLNDQEEPYLAPFIEFCWWLFVAGLATPLRWSKDGGKLMRFTLTAAGHRFLDAQNNDPLAPGLIARLRERCPGLPDEVLEHLGDAERCLRLQLLRPAVTLLGLAYEVAVAQVLDALARAGRVEQTQVDRAKAAARIDLLKGLATSGIADYDNRGAAERACDFAHDLRRRRNDAAHTRPRYALDDPSEVEELLVAAGRCLPALWAITGVA